MARQVEYDDTVTDEEDLDSDTDTEIDFPFFNRYLWRSCLVYTSRALDKITCENHRFLEKRTAICAFPVIFTVY